MAIWGSNIALQEMIYCVGFFMLCGAVFAVGVGIRSAVLSRKHIWYTFHLWIPRPSNYLSLSAAGRFVKGSQCYVNLWRAPTTICHLALSLFWCILRNDAAGLGWKKRLYCIRIGRTLFMWLCRFPAYCTERHIECLQLDLNGFLGFRTSEERKVGDG